MIELKGACGHPVHINEKYIVSVTSKNIYDLERTFVRTLKGDFFVCESVEEVLDIIMEKETTVGEGIMKGITRVIIETEGENPKTIAVITADNIEPAKGYRVRMRPSYDDKD